MAYLNGNEFLFGTQINGTLLVVDDELSPTSTNPIANKAVAEKFDSMEKMLQNLPSGGISLWRPNTEYKVGDVCFAESRGYYGYPMHVVLKCVEDHTSSDMAVEDFRYGKWIQLVINAESSIYDADYNVIHETYATKDEIPKSLKDGEKRNSLYQKTEKNDTALELGFTEIHPDVKGQIAGTYNKIAETGENATSLGTSIAKGKRSFNSGSSNLSTGKASITNGADNYNAGDNSAIFGYAIACLLGNCFAGGSKHILRDTNQTTGGHGNDLSGHCATAFGDGLIVSRYGQAVIGTYNKPLEDALFIIGCGTSDTDRKNALVVDGQGSVHIPGVVHSMCNDGRLY